MARSNSNIGIFNDLNVGAGFTVLADYTWKGDTNNAGTPQPGVTVNYPVGAIVAHDDRLWVAVHNPAATPAQVNDNVEPGSNAAFWQDLGDTNVLTLWSDSSHYETGNLVYYREDADAPFLLYVARNDIAAPAQGSTNTNPLEDTTNWLQVGGSDTEVLSTSRTETIGTLAVGENTANDPDGDPYDRAQYQFADEATLDQFVEDLQVGPQLTADDYTTELSVTPGDLDLVLRFSTAGAGQLLAIGAGAPVTVLHRTSATHLEYDRPTGDTTGAAGGTTSFDMFFGNSSATLTNPSLVAGDNIYFDVALNAEGDSVLTINTRPSTLTSTATAPVTGTHLGGAAVNLVSESDTSSVNIVSRDATIPTNVADTTGTAVSRAANGDIVITSPVVAAWAQDASNGLIIPASKLPNIELGNTHTFTSDSNASPEVPGVVSVATSGAGSTVGDPTELAATPLTRFYVGTDANGAGRVAVGAGAYTNTMVAWVADPNDATQYLVTITGDDATTATTDLAGINNTHTGIYLDQTDGSANSLQAPTGETVVTALVTAHVPANPNEEGEILRAVIANAGGQRDGDDPIAWHPGDLLVISGSTGDEGDNGIYVYVGVDQGTTAISPLTDPNNPTATNEEIFLANFRVVIAAADEGIRTSLTVDNGSRGTLNDVAYSTTDDTLTLDGSAAGTDPVIGLPLHISDAEVDDGTRAVNGFINHIKIGTQVYRFGPEPDLPVLAITPPTSAFSLYTANSQSVDFNAAATQDISVYGGSTTDPVTLTDFVYTPTPTSIRGYDDAHFNTATGVYTIPASTGGNTDLIQSDAAARLAVSGVGDASNEVAGVTVTYTADQLTPATASVTFRDERIAPTVAAPTSSALHVFTATAPTSNISNHNPTDGQIAAGTRYDVQGWQVTSTAAGVDQTAISTANAYTYPLTQAAYGGIVSNDATSNPSITRRFTYNFPMSDTPRNLQPDVDPANREQIITYYRPYGFFTGTAAPTAGQIPGVPFINVANRRTYTTAALNNVTINGTTGDTVFLVIPVADLPSAAEQARIRFRTTQSATLFVRLGSDVTATTTDGRTISYAVFQGGVLPGPSTTGTLELAP